MSITLKHIELFKSGMTNDGRIIAPERIAHIAENTRKAMQDGFHPKAKIGFAHETAKSRGIITRIEESTDSLFGDVEFPFTVYEDLTQGIIPEDRSIEIGKGFVLSDGTVLDEVLTGVVFGIDVPAVHQLKSLFDKFEKAESYERFSGIVPDSVKTKITKGGSSMEAIMELLKQILEKLARISDPDSESETIPSEIAENFSHYLKPEMENLKTVFGNIAHENDHLKKQNQTLIDRIETFESQLKTVFLNDLIDKKQLKPAQRETIADMYDVLTEKYGRSEAQSRITDLLHPVKDIHTNERILVTQMKAFNHQASDISPINHQ